MSFFMAAVLFVPGVVLGTLLASGLISVLGWNFLSLAALLALPPPLGPLVQAALAPGLIASWLALLVLVFVIVVVVFFLYWLASSGTPIPATPGGLIAAGLRERAGRGALVGLNAGMNLALLVAVFGLLSVVNLVSLVLALINFLACIRVVSNNRVYQVVLAYAALFLPMAFPMNLAGALVAAVNSVAMGFGAPLTWFVSWTRANLVMHGGVVHGCVRTAFNMCNYTVAHPTMASDDPWLEPGTLVWPFCPAGSATPPFVRTNTVNGTLFHEASHTLNVAAFGWIYHLVGFADEWAVMPWSRGVVLGANAHPELCAESGRRGAGRNWLDMWAPSLAAAATGNSNAVARVSVTAAPGVLEVSPARNPAGVAVDAAGNLFIAGGNRIRRVAGGTAPITIVAGTGTAGFAGDGRAAAAADLNAPSGVAVDTAGNLFIADSANNRIRTVTAATGIITTLAGTGTAGFAGDGGAATAADLNAPSAVAVDAAGNLFIADNANNRIRTITAATGIITTLAGTGTAGFAGDGGTATAADLNAPSAVAVDAAGNLFIADNANNRIRTITATTGIITTLAGTGTAGFAGDGGTVTAADLNAPSAVAVDAAGNLFIADSANNRIRTITVATGIITTLAGTGTAGFAGDGGTATGATLNVPSAVTVDAAGNVSIADAGNDRIRRVAAATGTITTVVETPRRWLTCERNRAVTLDSTASTDLDAYPMPLGRLWRLRTQPLPSAAAVGTPNAATLAFVPDVGGTYRLDFDITDGDAGGTDRGARGELRFHISTLQAMITPPPGPLAVGTAATLSSATSVIPTAGAAGTPTLAWEILATPAGSTLLGTTGTAATFTFTPDDVGGYTIRLTLGQNITPVTGGVPLTLTDSVDLDLNV